MGRNNKTYFKQKTISKRHGILMVLAIPSVKNNLENTSASAKTALTTKLKFEFCAFCC